VLAPNLQRETVMSDEKRKYERPTVRLATPERDLVDEFRREPVAFADLAAVRRILRDPRRRVRPRLPTVYEIALVPGPDLLQ
jgi:hypothetical protein